MSVTGTMGHVYVKATFYGQKGKREIDRLLVDTGATYTILPPLLAEEIGVFRTPYKTQLTLADRSRKDAAISLAEVYVEGRREAVQIAIMEDGVPVLGVQALEALGLEVNPVTKKLEAVREPGGLALSNIQRISLYSYGLVLPNRTTCIGH